MKPEGWRFVEQAAAWAGLHLTDEQRPRFERYAGWLVEEAIPAGALGRNEAARLWARHLADSLTLAIGWKGVEPPASLLDVGSGAGLPGIPLALVWPGTRVTLLDRAGRRIRLLQRAVHILELEAEVVQADLRALSDRWQGAVIRASLPPGEAVSAAPGLLEPGGRASLALSRRQGPPAEARQLLDEAARAGLEAELVQVPPDVLDVAAWILTMHLRGR